MTCAARRTAHRVLVLIPGFHFQMIRGVHVAQFDEAFPVFAIHGRVGGCPGTQAIDVAVVHTEGRGDQDSVVNLLIGCAIPRARAMSSSVTCLPPFCTLPEMAKRAFSLSETDEASKPRLIC